MDIAYKHNCKGDAGVLIIGTSTQPAKAAHAHQA